MNTAEGGVEMLKFWLQWGRARAGAECCRCGYLNPVIMSLQWGRARAGAE